MNAATVFERAQDGDEQSIEAAFEAVEIASRFYSTRVAEAVAEGRADRGILICGTGIGMCITANKFRGIRAALCYNEVAAELSRRHNNANILCLSGNFLSEANAEAIARLWLVAPFDGDRHQRRLELIEKIERETGL